MSENIEPMSYERLQLECDRAKASYIDLLEKYRQASHLFDRQCEELDTLRKLADEKITGETLKMNRLERENHILRRLRDIADRETEGAYCPVQTFLTLYRKWGSGVVLSSDESHELIGGE